ncbi:MAG: sortase [Chloroflexi bacterium]|nr:sortase [Chloroflexota bacterium]
MHHKLILTRFQKFLLPLLFVGLFYRLSWETADAATPKPYPTVTPTLVQATVAPTSAITPSVEITPTVAPGTTTVSPSPTIASTSPSTVTGVISIARTITATKPIPLRLQIPKFKIDAAIERVGSAPNGSMGIPKEVDNVAWYAPGIAPGEVGNAVIAGHLDRANGSPAVFWNIGKLKVGDELIVVSANKLKYHFSVTRVQAYPYDEAPMDDIFGFALQSQLNLITCNGVWNQGAHNYSKRLVVYTQWTKTTH